MGRPGNSPAGGMPNGSARRLRGNGMRIPLIEHNEATEDVEDIIAAIRHAAARSEFVGGPHVERFEAAWANFCGTDNAIGVANGTDAIELTLLALGIGPGEEVLVPTNTFISTAEAVSAAGALPRFVDVDPTTLLATPDTLEAGRTGRTAAIIAVHLYGHPAGMDELSRYADRHGLALIEDASQAHGGILDTVEPHRAGSYGHAGCFSFYPGRNLGAWGDGGAVVTDDNSLARRIRSLANHGRGEERDQLRVVGRDSRLDAIQAAVLTRKLPHLDQENRQRRRLVQRYRTGLGPLADDLVQPTNPDASAWHLLVMRVGRRDSVRRMLHRAGIATGIHYPVPCHLTPAYARSGAVPLPVAEAAAHEVLSLPLWPRMPEAQVDRVVEELWRALSKPAPHRATNESRPPTQRARR